MSKINDIKNKKLLKNKWITIALFLVIIAIYIEANILISKLNIPNIDATQSKIFSITDESKNRIANIDKSVNIQLYNFDETSNMQDYSYVLDFDDIKSFIKKYEQINSNIHVENLTDDNLNYPVIKVSSQEDEKIISLDDMYTYSYNTQNNSEEIYDLTEQVVTNAILNVAGSKKSAVYFYANHSLYEKYGLQNAFEVFLARLSNVGEDIYLIDLETAECVPDDCKVLVIPVITEDISEKEKNDLINYINKGGNILLFQESTNAIQLNAPNFQEVLDLYGISISNGVLLEESNENKIKGIPGSSLHVINSQSSIGKTVADNSKIVLMDSAKIDFKDEQTLNELNVTYEEIAKSSDTTYLRENFNNTSYNKSNEDINAPNATVSALIKKKVNDNNTSELIVFSNSILATNSEIYVQDSMGNQSRKNEYINLENNEEILINSVKYLEGNNQFINLRKKCYDNIPAQNIIKNGGIIELLFGFPMIIIIVGYFVWKKRKNKK